MNCTSIRQTIAVLGLVLSFVGLPALADAVSAATAGLQALNQGDLKNAIRLFTQAIESGTLSQNDLEYAYVERGNAYLQKNEPDHARHDADQALSLNPADQDAVALWKETTIEAQPGKPEELSPATVIYKCGPEGVPEHADAIEFQINFDRQTIKGVNFGEEGRKLGVSISASSITWHEHLEDINSNGATEDQDLTLARDGGLLLNRWSTSEGRHGVTRLNCHMGQ